MPENPLLPNAQLRAMHTLLRRAAELKASGPRAAANAKKSKPPRSREALLAGTLVQLTPADVLVAAPADLAPASLLTAEGNSNASAPSVLQLGADSAQQLTLAAGLAHGLLQAGSTGIVLTLLQAGCADPAWAKTLAWVQDAKLPLVLACADPSGQEAFRTTPQSAAEAQAAPLHWSSLAKVASRLKLPVLSVDGEDAVAVYRVMQESALRARSGGGPAVLWAMLPSETELAAKRPKTALPLRRLEHYLKQRDIAVEG